MHSSNTRIIALKYQWSITEYTFFTFLWLSHRKWANMQIFKVAKQDFIQQVVLLSNLHSLCPKVFRQHLFFSEVGYFRILHYATILHTCQWNRTEHLGAATHNPTVMSDGAFIHYLRDESERQNQTSNINITRRHSFSCVSQCNQMVLTWKFQHWVSVSPEEQRQLRGQIPYRCSWFHLNHWLRGCLQTSGHVIVYF